MPYTAAIFSILAMLAVTEDVKGAANGNIKHFRSLCYLVRLAQSNMPTPSDRPDATSGLEDILKLNMTVAEKSWLQLFEGEPTTKDWNKVEPTITNTDAKKDWPTKWPKWLDTRHKMQQPKGPEAWEKKHPVPQDFFQQQQAREKLKRISAAAEAAAADITTLKEAQTNTDIKGLQDKLTVSGLTVGAMQQILAACPDLPAAPQNIADATDAAAQTIASLLAEDHKTGKVFLGKDTDGNCALATDNCVAYDAYYSAKHLGFESIPWVKALRQAQQHYRDYLDRENTKDLAAAKVAQMRVAAEAAYSAANIALPLQKQIAGQQGTGTQELTKKTKCKLKNSTAEECPRQHCD
uniref:Variant surface glycoprotein 1125.1436 n=1 Tax=Trypanosoma brucei TaxID=5691 RepID=A0A1J0R774_9TRYP|nr:variant surface glycoprotein 1125.1436 [Trypanosoma brucei]